MAVAIRCSRHGRKNVPLYRIVATDEDNPRDGRYLELLGTMNPSLDPPAVKLKEDRVKYWISVGAKPSHTLQTILEKEYPGYFSTIVTKRREKLVATRKKRKTRTKKKK